MDKQREFEEIQKETKEQINNLKEKGIDVSFFESYLKDIINLLNQKMNYTMELATTRGTNYAVRYVDNCYENAIIGMRVILISIKKCFLLADEKPETGIAR